MYGWKVSLLLQHGSADLVLIFEVVIDIAQRDPGLLRNVLDRGTAEPAEIGGLPGGLQESAPAVCFHSWHYAVL